MKREGLQLVVSNPEPMVHRSKYWGVVPPGNYDSEPATYLDNLNRVQLHKVQLKFGGGGVHFIPVEVVAIGKGKLRILKDE